MRSRAKRDSSSRFAIARVRSLSATSIIAKVRTSNVVAAAHHAMSEMASHGAIRLATPPATTLATTLMARRRRAGTHLSSGGGATGVAMPPACHPHPCQSRHAGEVPNRAKPTRFGDSHEIRP